MDHENSRYLFLRYWRKGKAVDLAQSLERVLDVQAPVSPEPNGFPSGFAADHRKEITCSGFSRARRFWFLP
jgi:hypothetical protein